MVTQQTKTGQRCRTGCWTCKGRRVKCTEERPTCSKCSRLGLSCHYGIKLLWREDALSRGIALGRSGAWSKVPGKLKWGLQDHYDVGEVNHPPPQAEPVVIQDWMFVNTTYMDFQDTVEEIRSAAVKQMEPQDGQAVHHNEDGLRSQPRGRVRLHAFDGRTESSHDETSLQDGRSAVVCVSRPAYGANQRPQNSRALGFLLGQTLSPFAIGQNELYLLDYFTKSLSPRCTLWPADNPFNTTIVPLCLSAPTKSLFYTVMAVASHQLSLLNDVRFERDIWLYRDKALRGFQEDIRRFRDRHNDPVGVGWEQIVSTLIMLAFFDISQNGSSTWLVHLRCARSLPALLPSSSTQLSAEQAAVRRFFSSYFIEHEALARTASRLDEGLQKRDATPWLAHGIDLNMTVIDSVLGCSHELMFLLSAISDLAEEQESVRRRMLGAAGARDAWARNDRLQAIRARRNDIERALFTLRQDLPPHTTTTPTADPAVTAARQELQDIAESRRLASLLYLYYRLDGLRPRDPSIVRLTRQILALVPRISLRSHAVLWQLFVVGTMGLGVPAGETGDEDRQYVLERLARLQGTRQLKHVGRAREAMEAVWRARDLRGPEGGEEGDWEELVGARGGGVSLC